MKGVSLFTGAGGFELGFDEVGIETQLMCEIDPYARKVLKYHWPGIEISEDVGELNAIPKTDVIFGGFPCQNISNAGSREGLAGKSSGLFLEFARIIGAAKPSWVVIENVLGLLSSGQRRDMGTILSTLGKLGYGFAYRVLDARWFGVPQRRRRVFIVGYLGDPRCAAKVLFEPEGVCRDTVPSEEKTQTVAAFTANSVGAGVGGDDNSAQAGHIFPEVMGTLSPAFEPANYSNIQEVVQGSVFPIGFHFSQDPISSENAVHALGVKKTGPAAVLDEELSVRRLMPVECERLMGWPDHHTVPAGSDSQRFKLCGNGVVAPVAKWIGKRIVEQGCP